MGTIRTSSLKRQIDYAISQPNLDGWDSDLFYIVGELLSEIKELESRIEKLEDKSHA